MSEELQRRPSQLDQSEIKDNPMEQFDELIISRA